MEKEDAMSAFFSLEANRSGDGYRYRVNVGFDLHPSLASIAWLLARVG